MEPLKTSLLTLIDLYQRFVSPMMAPHCRFYPTCSSYAQEAIGKYGALKGSYLAIKRLLKCHPWHPGGIDLVPDDCSCNAKNTSISSK